MRMLAAGFFRSATGGRRACDGAAAACRCGGGGSNSDGTAVDGDAACGVGAGRGGGSAGLRRPSDPGRPDRLPWCHLALMMAMMMTMMTMAMTMMTMARAMTGGAGRCATTRTLSDSPAWECGAAGSTSVRDDLWQLAAHLACHQLPAAVLSRHDKMSCHLLQRIASSPSPSKGTGMGWCSTTSPSFSCCSCEFQQLAGASTAHDGVCACRAAGLTIIILSYGCGRR
jgi:hypothetical protein